MVWQCAERGRGLGHAHAAAAGGRGGDGSDRRFAEGAAHALKCDGIFLVSHNGCRANGNTVEWLVPGDNIVIKMTAAQGDNDFARIWFEDSEGQLVGRGQYQLRRNGPDGEVAPYTGDNWGYIVDYRKNYTMAGPDGREVFTLSHQQKQQSWFSQVDYIVRRPDGTIWDHSQAAHCQRCRARA